MKTKHKELLSDILFLSGALSSGFSLVAAAYLSTVCTSIVPVALCCGLAIVETLLAGVGLVWNSRLFSKKMKGEIPW